MAAVQEMAQLGPALAVPLLEFALSVYHLHVELLQQLRPDVVLTCLQTAHGAVLGGDLLDAALHAVLGYAPRIVHCAAEDLAGVWRDMQVGGGAERPGCWHQGGQRSPMAGSHRSDGAWRSAEMCW